MKRIPIALVYSRLPAAAVFLWVAYQQPHNYQTIMIMLLIYGLISDFFDGFIARRLGVSNEHLRRADSTIDQFFWISVIVGTAITSWSFYANHWWMVILLLGLEALCYLVSYIKFRKEVATHAIASKLWVLTLFAFFIDIIWNGNSTTLFYICLVVGVVTRLEILAILFTLVEWTNDVPSIYHAIQLRKGKPIKRNKIFNGSIRKVIPVHNVERCKCSAGHLCHAKSTVSERSGTPNG